MPEKITRRAFVATLMGAIPILASPKLSGFIANSWESLEREDPAAAWLVDQVPVFRDDACPRWAYFGSGWIRPHVKQYVRIPCGANVMRVDVAGVNDMDDNVVVETFLNNSADEPIIIWLMHSNGCMTYYPKPGEWISHAASLSVGMGEGRPRFVTAHLYLDGDPLIFPAIEDLPPAAFRT